MAKIIEDNDEMLAGISKAEAEVKEASIVPAGYIPIELSTMGLVGAPARFHTRNFDTTDLMNLALSEDEELPEKVAKMLNNLILEDDVDVKDFHEKEVVEFLIRVYQAFYSSVLKDVSFPWTKDDIDLLQQQYGDTPEFRTQRADLETGRWKPVVDIDLASVETYDIDEAKFKKTIFISPKSAGEKFTVGFSFPRYGDIIVLRNFMMNHFREQDKRFANTKNILKFRQDAEERARNGENIDISRLPDVPQATKDEYKEYATEKSLFGALAIKALHITYFNGEDVSRIPLADRIKLAADPRIDYSMMKKVNDYFEGLDIGLQQEVNMLNPFTSQMEKRRYSFRFLDILQAIKLHESDEFDIDFEPPHQ